MLEGDREYMAGQKVISRQTGVEEQQYRWGFEFDI
ncbi:uncharacterized protein METZ01_LOCUS375934, partial [marine metagenome]